VLLLLRDNHATCTCTTKSRRDGITPEKQQQCVFKKETNPKEQFEKKKNKILSPKKLDQRFTISPIQEEVRTTMPQTWTGRVEERGPLDSGEQTQQQQT
jgi:hypothetical protein